jgi:4-diphosphocytidyl-2-C-methyl-D-erythritol kinase
MDQLHEIGLTLGADLPMCLERQPLVARGVGEQLHVLPQFPPLPMVLANPGVGVSTPAVFGALARRDNPPLPEIPRFADSAEVAAWLAGTRNDLTEPALGCAPPIADALDALDRQGAMLARMSGSGATCFGLFREVAEAEYAASRLGAERPDWFVVATIAQGTQD